MSRISCWLLLAVACLFVASTTTAAELSGIGRVLLKRNSIAKEDKETMREEDALEAYFLQQSQLNKEQESLIRFGSEDALVVVRKLQKSSSRPAQVKLIADLWANAKGITIVKTLATLIELKPSKTEDYYALNSDAMEQAESKGYTIKVSEALYNGLAVTDSTFDHHRLLNALLYRMDLKNKESKGSGCQYIQFLFTDAEAWAINDGRIQNFFRGFEHQDYLPIAECFLPACKGSAAKCCSEDKAISTGLCACKILDKKEGTMQCEHNLFSTAPRTIWLCGTQDCQPDEKCLCGADGGKKKEKNSKGKGGKSKSKSGSKSKGKGKEEPSKKEEKKSSKNSSIENKNGKKSKRVVKTAKDAPVIRKGKGSEKKRSGKKGNSKSPSKNGKGKKTT